jgi:hypothetical protein
MPVVTAVALVVAVAVAILLPIQLSGDDTVRVGCLSWMTGLMVLMVVVFVAAAADYY